MKALGSVMIIGFLCASSFAQGLKFDKRAVDVVKRTFVSTLEEAMPRRPFSDWFNATVGAQSGVIWQVSECEQVFISRENAGDHPACVETHAILPDGRKVIVKVTVGTFKKGISGNPRFIYAVIEQQGKLLLINRLRDLPVMLSSAEEFESEREGKVIPSVYAVRAALILNTNWPVLGKVKSSDAPPPPPSAPPANSAHSNGPVSTPPIPSKAEASPRRVSTGALLGNVLKEVGPIYPKDARRVNAWGEVQVLITISAAGQVVEARAVNGHLLLRKAAVAAARQWIFAPALFNGRPIPVQGIITFDFPL